MSTNLGDAVTKQLTTTRLYWTPAGDNSFIDFGNSLEYKDDPQIERVPHMQAQKGFRRLDFALIKATHSKKSFTFDEHFVETIKLLLLSNQLNNITQVTAGSADEANVTADSTVITADDGGTQVVLNPVLKKRTYDLGFQQVTIASIVDGNNTPLVLGVDYALDAAAGMLTVLQDAPVGPWTVIFNIATVTDYQFAMFSNLLTTGTFKQVEFDQFSQVPLFTETFSGQVFVTGWGENKTDGYNEFIVEVITDNIVRLQRST